MTDVLKLQSQSDTELDNDTPFSATSIHHCADGEEE